MKQIFFSLKSKYFIIIQIELQNVPTLQNGCLNRRTFEEAICIRLVFLLLFFLQEKNLINNLTKFGHSASTLHLSWPFLSKQQGRNSINVVIVHKASSLTDFIKSIISLILPSG